MRTVLMIKPIKALLIQALVFGVIVPVVATISLPASASASSFPVFVTPIPAAITLSVPPLSTVSVSAAGLPSALPPGAHFVPQTVPNRGKADPVLLAQIEQAVTLSAKNITSEQAAAAPIGDYWAVLLSKYTTGQGPDLIKFDYGALKNASADMAVLEAYIDQLAVKTPSNMARNEAMAYWANLYNALTVQVVAQNYPVKSIRKIKTGLRAGPWKRKLVMVEGRNLSLDDIEHGIMRPTFKTPLVHYMVNCASIGCPNLKATPWSGTNLDAELEKVARDFINSPRGTLLANGRLQVSSIYKWFKKDFGGNDAGVLAHIRTYAHKELLDALKGKQKIDKYAYDWSVNAPK